MRGVDPQIVRFVMTQLCAGTTRHDFLYLLGRSILRRMDQLIMELEENELLDFKTLSANYSGVHENSVYMDFPSGKIIFPESEVFVFSGECHSHLLPATIERMAAPRRVIYDLKVAGGYLVLARARNADFCFLCMLLWFLGGRSLPSSFLGANLNCGNYSGKLRKSRIDGAFNEVRKHSSIMMYYPDMDDAPIVCTPRGAHPACACSSFRRHDDRLLMTQSSSSAK